MLYVTTRNKLDAHTSYRTLACDYGSDGGLYVPFRFPKFTEQEIDALKHMPFKQCVAQMLNTFFGIRLDGWDIDFCIGRYPIKLIPLNHRIVVGEIWRNPDWDFARLVRNLSGRIQGVNDQQGKPSNWAWIAVRIAVLFGLFSEMERLELTDSRRMIDVAVYTGDFSAPISVLYARKMGLPIGNIICSCNENSPLWELLHNGMLRSGQEESEIPANLERLIFEVLGFDETQRYVRAVREGAVYTPSEFSLKQLRESLSAVVVSQKRVEQIIPNVYRTSTYVLAPQSALAYGALLDHRATASEKRTALLLTETGPACEIQSVAAAMGIPVSELKERINIM